LYILKLVLSCVAALLLWAGLSIYLTLYGWLYFPEADGDSIDNFVDSLHQIVTERNVGNVAMVVIENGRVQDEFFSASSQQLSQNTLFPAASMSKWITALGIMTLVQDGRLDLNESALKYLSRWQPVEGVFDWQQVTVRQLLSHTSGLTDGLGFGDYQPDEQLPSLEESLQDPRSSSGETVLMQLGREPGAEWDYSGGGYLILQLIIEEVTGETFEDYMQVALLKPLGMQRSTFSYLGDQPDHSISYHRDGTPAVTYQYAAAGATGFASSIADMTKLVQALVTSTKSSAPINNQLLQTMRQPHGQMYGIDIWGLGTILYAPVGNQDVVFGHDGQNDPAINSAVRINPVSGDAIVVFSSGNPSLATFIGFEWVYWQTGLPDFLGLGYVVPRGMMVFCAGAILIMLSTGIVAWRRRRPATILGD
jgi:CubicO group peptidase (beta-lactamase class C family)